jgi:hypothetical protein
MAVNDYTDKGFVTKYGGGILKVREVSDAGVYTSGDTYVLGYLETTTIKYEKPKEDINDETGNTVKTLFGNAMVGLTGVLMQSGANLLDFLRDLTEAKFYQLYYKMTPTGDLNGITQELFAGIAVITPKFELVSGTRRPPFEITFLKNDSAITITTPDSVYGCVETDTVTIAAGKYYEIVEN